MEEAPFYEMVKGLSLFTVVERFEPLASTVLALGYFCAMSLLLCAARACFGGKRALYFGVYYLCLYHLWQITKKVEKSLK